MTSASASQNIREPKPLASVRRILVFYPRKIGDWIALTPFLRSLKWKFPNASIVAVASFRSAPVLPLIPFCDHFRILERPQKVIHNLKLLSFFIKSEPWDMLIDLDPNPAFSRTGWAAMRLTRAKTRMSFARPGTESFEYLIPTPTIDEPMISRYGRMAEFLGAPYDPIPELRVPKIEIEAAAREMSSLGFDRRPKILIHPGDLKREEGARWPRGKFAALGRRLREDGFNLYFLAGPGEKKSVASLAQSMGINTPIIIARPLIQAAAFMLQADLFLSTIAGTYHVAAALGVPTFSFYTGSEWQIWRVPGGNHQGLIGDWEDCRPIEVDKAYRALINHLKSFKRTVQDCDHDPQRIFR